MTVYPPSRIKRARATKTEMVAYLCLHPETAHGGDRKSDQVDKLSTRSFADDQAAKTGVDARTVRCTAERSEKITPAALVIERGTVHAATLAELRRLARLGLAGGAA